MKRCQKMILSALEHIQNAQQPNGSFITLSSTREKDFSHAIPRSTTFFASNILLCLETADGYLKTFLSPEAGNILKGIKKKAAHFLLGQKSRGWSFNYWDRKSLEAATTTYPDDLDDTFAALAALIRHNTSIVDGGALAEVANLLVALEIQEGGPYKTWLVEKNAAPKWRDVDIAVNSTIGYFLSLINVKVPHLERLLEDAIEKDLLSSPYYPGPLHVGYFISRYYGETAKNDNGNGVVREKLADAIAEHLKNLCVTITPLERAMAISSLIKLGREEKIPSADTALLLSDLERIGYAPYPFCIDPARDGQRSYAGASALTAACSIEALCLMATDDVTRMAEADAGAVDDMTVKKKTAFHERIRSLARTACADAGNDLCPVAVAQIEKTSDEKITFLAQEFQSTLQLKRNDIPYPIIEQVSLANLYGWMAYTIYDDVLDGDGTSDTSLTSCANLFLRKLSDVYHELDRVIPGAQDLFKKMMDRMDNANSWELNHCRIPANAKMPFVIPSFADHENLADRSIGHSMGPLMLLLYIGCGAGSKEYQYVLWLFRHYLIARQLHDDARDWMDDLLRGRVNSVGAIVIRHFQKSHSHEAGSAFDVPTILPVLQKIFWEEAINEAAALIERHVTAARAARERSGVLSQTGFMEGELCRLEASARKARKERNDAILFLKNYRQAIA